MKINLWGIIEDHFRTLYDAESGKVNYFDLFIFYFSPLVIFIISWSFGLKIKSEGYNVSVTFFGIFIALLLNIQVVIFSIFQNKWSIPQDKKLAEDVVEYLNMKKKLLRELNSNISYLTVVSSVALIVFIVLFVGEWVEGLGPSVGAAIYLHFIFTFAMIVKRSYILFQKEYE